jgi:hypothetical protein
MRSGVSGAHFYKEMNIMAFKIENGVLVKYTEENGVTDVVIPDEVTEIGEEAFSRCNNIVSVSISENVQKIGKYAFSFCERLEKVNIPHGVKIIEISTFYSCKSLKSIDIPDSVTEISDFAFRESGLESVTIPDSVVKIGYEAFMKCKSLKSVSLGKSLKELGGGSFEQTAISSIVIPENVTRIISGDFALCPNLESVTFLGGVPQLDTTHFRNCKLKYLSVKNCDVYFIKSPDECKYASNDEKLRVYIYHSPYLFVNNDIRNNMYFMTSGDYSVKCWKYFKWAYAAAKYIHDGDEEARNYIKKSLSNLVKTYISFGDAYVISILAESNEFFTKKNISKFIDMANESGNSKIIDIMRKLFQ